jgi:anti-sigma28 factor (negative regulator of flagellin synthesis)
MKVNEIYRLLGRVDSSLNKPEKKPETLTTDNAAASEAQPSTQQAAAVSVDENLKAYSSEIDDQTRQLRVAELKKAVADRSYKPDTTEVAKAVYRELFV